MSHQGVSEMQGNSRLLTTRLFPVYVAGAMAVIFWLPYYVPVTPSASYSYLFGYNNKVGEALLLIFVVIGVIWTKGLHLSFAGASSSPPVSHKTLIWSLVAALLCSTAMYVLVGRLGGFGESAYEIDRVWLTSQGKSPYLDFEWLYGLILLYGPIAFHRLLPIGIVEAYYLFWLLNTLLGVWLLFAVVNAVDYPSPHKKSIFLLIYSAWFLAITSMGTNYTMTRYALPLYFVLMVDRTIRKGSRRSRALSTALIVVFTIALILYSPETAIAFAFASAALFLLLGARRNARFFGSFAALLAVLGAVFWGASKLHVLDGVKAGGGGANSFPIILCGHILLFFVAVFVSACYLYRRLTARSIDDNSIGLLLYSIPMLAAALERCDPAHVIFNGMGIFLAMLFYASNHNTVWKYTKLAFVVMLIGLPALGGLWFFFLPSLAKSQVARLAVDGTNSTINRMVVRTGEFYIDHFAPPAKKEKWRQKLEDALQGTPADVADIYPQWHGTYVAPFGYKPNGVGTGLSSQIDYGRYEGTENAYTLAAINDKVTEMRDNPEKALLLPNHYEGACEIDLPSWRESVEFLFAAPYFKAAAHPESLRRPICRYIQDHYVLAVEPNRQNGFYGLWIKRGTALSR
jgi:hypothetical protein